MHLKNLGDQEEAKLSTTRRKWITNIWAEINEIETQSNDNTKDQWNKELVLSKYKQSWLTFN
jgi:hypothetical protein